MPAAEKTIRLTTTQMACLDALEEGLQTKTKIALHVGQNLRNVAAALEILRDAGLVEHRDGNIWRPLGRNRHRAIDVVPAPKRRGPGRPPGRSASDTANRMLAALERPRHGRALTKHLGVARQRVHQLIVQLHAEGLVRIGDPETPMHIIARSEDASILLTRDEERILSAVPERTSATAPRLSVATRVPHDRLLAMISALQAKGMLEQVETNRGQASYQLTAEGRDHFQRDTTKPMATPLPLPVRSQRVFDVLGYISELGEARIVEIGHAFGISQQIINGLMQSLKSRGLVEKKEGDRYAPYVLTDDGKATLEGLVRNHSR